MADETLLELTKSVARMEAQMENVVETVKTMGTEVKELKAMSEQAAGATKATKAVWAILGIVLGFGGGEASEVIQALLNNAPN